MPMHSFRKVALPIIQECWQRTYYYFEQPICRLFGVDRVAILTSVVSGKDVDGLGSRETSTEITDNELRATY
jgi:hypothetical protein